MQSLHILDVKLFMQLLFQTDKLDAYEFVTGELLTDMKYTLDGTINHSFFSMEETDSLGLYNHTYLPWSCVKEKIFYLIKGKKTPASLKIVLRVPDESMGKLMEANTSFTANDIDGMFVNIHFSEQKLNIIFGISYKIFSLDKELENILSNNFITLLKENKITTELQ